MTRPPPTSTLFPYTTLFRSIRIKARGHFAIELLEKLLSRPPSLDVLAHDAGLTHVAHHEIFATGILVDLARGGFCLLVVILAVNQRGESVARVRLDAFPDVEHRPARRIHQHARDRAQSLEVPDRHAERRQDHYVVCADRAEVELTIPPVRPVQELHTHRGELLIDVGIMDDLADEKRALVRKLGACFIGVLNRAVQALTEAELARH